jgi:HEAT repeat protein
MSSRNIKGLAMAIILMALSLAAPANLRGYPAFDSGANGAPDKALEAYKKAYDLILNESWDKAIPAFQEVIKQYPGNAVEDDSAFYICLAKEKSGANKEAVRCYGQFVAKYPKSTYVNDASANMTRLAQSLAVIDPGVKSYVDSVKEEKDINIKLLALQAIIDSDGAKEALPVIIKLYDKTTKPDDKEKILYMMNDIDDPSVLVKLSEIVQSDPLPEMRKKAVYALGDHGEEAAPELKKIVKSKNDAEVRKAALYSLAQTNSPDVVTFLGDVAKTETDAELAKAATYAIGEVDSKESSAALQSVLKSSAITEVRKAALHALADHVEGSIPTLKATALNDQDEEIRKTAVYAIADNHSKDSVDALKEILSTSKDPKVQESALYALADHGGPGVQPVLMQTAISNPEERLAKAAVYAMADLTEGDTSLLLEVFRKSKFDEVRKAALYAISDHSQHKSAIESLSRILKEEKEEEYRVVALQALANVEGDEVVPILADVAKNDSSSRIRTVAVQMLGQIGTPAAKKVLMDILEKE